jgi:fibro-slime domain-containing protein
VLSATGTAGCVASPSSFQEWYTDGPNRATFPSELLLFDNGAGGFVNRYGANGEKWTAATNPVWVDNDVGNCAPTCIPCPWSPAQGCSATLTEYDGNPLFFPLDDAPNALSDARSDAKVGPAYGYDSWPWESTIIPTATSHDFHFTSEVRYWFEYDASASATLDFTGDDDMWVFVNGRLAVDLGGVHEPADGSVTINALSAASFGLSDGNVYEISVFHAERKLEGSTFRLTLEGFSAQRSDCEAVCGDAIVALGEQCDDGVNDGGYGECDAGCVLGPHCGDGIVQDAEDCDDGNRRDGDDCGSACRILEVR